MRLIDADAFKEYICNALEQTRQCYPDGGRWAETITEQFCLDIDEQPTVNPEPHWIPCSERLPKREGFYLVTLKHRYGDETSIRFFKIENGEPYWSKWGNETITAWMPKPEPYNEVTT